MITINRFGFGVVIAGVFVASIAGCRHDPSTASRGSAAYDRASTPAPAASPEAASAVAATGEPAATLRPDSLDGPAPTSVQEAARSARMAAAGHAMPHGTYRQVDAGRDGVPAAPPGAPDPHAGHGKPAPGPAPSPSPKENR